MAKNNNLYLPLEEKPLEQWVKDTIDPVIIIIDQIMEQIISVFMEFDNYVH